jgi:hypothetical protein
VRVVRCAPEDVRKNVVVNVNSEDMVIVLHHLTALISSAARPPIMKAGALVGPEMIDGMTDVPALFARKQVVESGGLMPKRLHSSIQVPDTRRSVGRKLLLMATNTKGITYGLYQKDKQA